jgi:hypothetical protein
VGVAAKAGFSLRRTGFSSRLVCGRQSGDRTGFAPRNSVIHYQLSTNIRNPPSSERGLEGSQGNRPRSTPSTEEWNKLGSGNVREGSVKED